MAGPLAVATGVTDFVTGSLERIGAGLRRAMAGLPSETLNRRPSPDTNSMAWLCWHLTRCQDNWVAGIAGAAEVYASDGWHARLGFPLAIDDWGIGHTAAQVAMVRVDGADVLLDYYDSVVARTTEVLAGLGAADMGREVPSPIEGQPPSTVELRLRSLVSVNTQHLGQVNYLRGLFEDPRWFPA